MADTSTSTYLLSVDFELIENYSLSTPTPQSELVATLINANGEAEVFYVGTDGNIYHLQPDSGGTGWASETLPSPGAGSVIEIAAALDGENHRWVCVSYVGMSSSDQGIYVNTDSSGAWNTDWTWNEIGPPVHLVLKQGNGKVYIAGTMPRGGAASAGYYAGIGYLTSDGNVFFGSGPSWGFCYLPNTDIGNVDFTISDNGVVLFQVTNPQLYLTLVDDYTTLYSVTLNNIGDIGFYRPKSPDEVGVWNMVGDACAIGQPSSTCLMLASVEDPTGQQTQLLQVPSLPGSDGQTWDTHNMAGSSSSASIWSLVCPVGYMALGSAVNSGPGTAPRHTPPSITSGGKISGPANYSPIPIAVLSNGVAQAVRPQGRIFTTKGISGADPLSIYQTATGCFYAEANFDSIPQGDTAVVGQNTLQLGVVCQASLDASVDATKVTLQALSTSQFNAVNWCMTEGPTGQELLSVGTDNRLYYLDQTQSPAAWGLVDPTESKALTFSAWSDFAQWLVAVVDGASVLHTFAVGKDDGLLYHAAKPQGGSWTSLAPIAGPVISVAAAVNGDGEVDVIALRMGGQILHLTLDPESQEWDEEPIELPPMGAPAAPELQELRAYTTEITVTDLQGVPQANLAVTIAPSADTTLIVNGTSYRAGPLNPVSKCTTNPCGQLTILQEPQLLSVPTLLVSFPGAPSQPPTPIEPVRATLDTVTSKQPADLAQIVPASLQNEANYTALSQAFAQLASMAQPSGEQGQVPAAISPRSPRRDSIRVPGTGIQTGAEEFYMDLQFRFKEGAITFSDDPSEVAARMLALKARLVPPQGVAVAPGSTHNVGFGDCIEWLMREARHIAGILINGANVVVHLITSAGEWLIETTINTAGELANQAVDLIGTILVNIQDDISTAAQKIKDWLSFLFDWHDILLTQRAITDLVTSALKGTVSELKALQSFVNKQFSTLQSTVDTQIGNLKSGLENATFGPQSQSSGVHNNMVSSHVMNGTGSSAVSGSPSLSAPAGFSDGLNSSGLQNAFKAASWYTSLTNIINKNASNPGALFATAGDELLSGAQLVFDTLLTDVHKVVDFLLKIAEGAIQGLQEMLTATWDVPIVSQLFSRITEGEDLTTLNLLSLLLAIPATIAYKTATGLAPFSASPAAGTLSTTPEDFRALFSPDAVATAIKKLFSHPKSGETTTAAANVGTRVGSLPPTSAQAVAAVLLPIIFEAPAAFRALLNPTMDTFASIWAGTEAAPPLPLLSKLDVSLAVVEFGLGLPVWGIIGNLPSNNLDAAALGLASYSSATSLGLLAANAFLVFCDPTPGTILQGVSMRLSSAWGCLVQGIFGLISNLVAGVATALGVASQPNWDQAPGVIAAALSIILSILPVGLWQPFSEATTGISNGVTLCGDFGLNLGLFATGIAQGFLAVQS